MGAPPPGDAAGLAGEQRDRPDNCSRQCGTTVEGLLAAECREPDQRQRGCGAEEQRAIRMPTGT